MKSIVYRDCEECKQKKVPHKRMENFKDSPLICESCKNEVTA